MTAISLRLGCRVMKVHFYSSSAFLFCIDNKKKPEISYPTQFEHTIHVGFDPVTGEFTVRYTYENFVCQWSEHSVRGKLHLSYYHIKPVHTYSDMSRYFLSCISQLLSPIFVESLSVTYECLPCFLAGNLIFIISKLLFKRALVCL